MVSDAKRMKYVSDMSSSDDEDLDFGTNFGQSESSGYKNPNRKPTRTPKVFSKNALLARENRLRKKMYLSNLENDLSTLKDENRKLSTVVDNQSFLIADLKKQVKYLKSVIANSNDISKLVRNIHQSTGMSVSSSLDKNLSLNNSCISKRKVPVPTKTAHPWDENKQYPSFPTPESYSESSPTAEYGLNEDFPLDLLSSDFNFNLPDDGLFDTIPMVDELTEKDTLSEHDYTQKISTDDDDIGVCLHVSKHRVSLEFCSSCSENATQSWIS